MSVEPMLTKLLAFNKYAAAVASLQEDKLHLKPGAALSRWVPSRYCQKDWILCVRVFRFSKTRYEIGLFLAEDHEDFVRDAGVMGGLVLSLSDAYYYTGRMEINFKGVPGELDPASIQRGYEPIIPESVRRVAAQFGVTFADDRTISDAEGRNLFVQLTRIDDWLTELLSSSNVDAVQAAFLINRGIWNIEQIRAITLQTLFPRAVFDGALRPELRIVFQHELLILRFALGIERLQHLLESENALEPGRLAIRFESSTDLVCTVSAVTAIEDTAGYPWHLECGQKYPVRIAFHESEVQPSVLPTDRNGRSMSAAAIILVATDFLSLPDNHRSQIIERFRNHGQILLVAPDTLAEMDREIIKRLAQSVSTRRPLMERPE